MALLVPYLFFTCISLLISLSLRLKFSNGLIITFFISTLSCYICGIIHHLNYGIPLTILITLIIVIYKRKLIKKNLKHQLISLLSSPTFILYTIIYLLIYIYQLNQGFSFYDEYMHWGLFVREGYRLNDLYIVNQSQVWYHKDYPPFIAIFQTLNCFLCNGYVEAYCYRALDLLALSIPLLIIDNHKLSLKKSLIFYIGCLIIPLCIQITSTSSDLALFYNSIYLDWIISMFAGYSIYIVLFNDFKKNWYILLINLTFLVMSKQIGLFFYGLIMILIIYKSIKDKSYCLAFVSLILPLVCFFSWSILVDYYNAAGQFTSGGIDFDILLNIIVNHESELAWQIQTYDRYIHDILFDIKFNFPFPCSYIMYILLQSIVILIIGLVKKNKSEGFTLSALYLLGGIAYAAVLCVLYLFTFAESESLNLSSLNRYLNTYTLVGLIFIYCYLYFSINGKFKFSTIIPILLLLTCIDYNHLSLNKPAITYDGAQDAKFNRLIEVMNNIEDNSLVIVVQYPYIEYPMIRYFTSNPNIRMVTFSQETLSPTGTSDNDIINNLLQFDLIYTYSVDDYFLQQSAELFNTSIYLDERLYRVNACDHTLTLIDHENTIESTKDYCSLITEQ